jgi:MFS family permease
MTYISSANQAHLSARYRLTRLIIVALGISTLLYVAIGWAFAPAMPRGDYAWLTNSHYIIVSIVLMAALVTVFLRRWLLSSARLLNAGRRGLNTLLGQLYMASLLGAVIGDVVGILGVVASLMTGNKEYSWRLGIAALLLIGYSFPRRGEWERAVAVMEEEKSGRTEPQAAEEQIKLGLLDAE